MHWHGVDFADMTPAHEEDLTRRAADIQIGRALEGVQSIERRLDRHMEAEERFQEGLLHADKEMAAAIASLRQEVENLKALHADVKDLVEILKGLKFIKQVLLVLASMAGAVTSLFFFSKSHWWPFK